MVRKCLAVLFVLLLCGSSAALATGGQAGSGLTPGDPFYDAVMGLKSSQYRLTGSILEKAVLQNDLANRLVDAIMEEEDEDCLEELYSELEKAEMTLFGLMSRMMNEPDPNSDPDPEPDPDPDPEAGFTVEVDSVESVDGLFVVSGRVTLRYFGPEQTVRVLVEASVPEGAGYTLEGRDGDIWYPITTHWGPAEGFPVTDGYEAVTPVRLWTDLPGDYAFTLTLVGEDDSVLATAQVEVNVGAAGEDPEPAPETSFTYDLDSVEWAIVEGLFVVNGRVTLFYRGPEQTVRVLVDAAVPEGAGYTLEGRDGDTWYPITTYWGPAEGFPVTDGYEATTPVRLKTDLPGEYAFTLALVGEDGTVLATADIEVVIDPSEEFNWGRIRRGWRLRQKVADESLPAHVRANAQKALNNMARAMEHHAWAQSGEEGPPPWAKAWGFRNRNGGGDDGDEKNGEENGGGEEGLENGDGSEDREDEGEGFTFKRNEDKPGPPGLTGNRGKGWANAPGQLEKNK